MMITCVAAFGICWLPLNTLMVVADEQPNIWELPYIQYVWFFSHWLAMSHACYNPIIYCWMNSRFRAGFKYIFRFLPCIARVEQYPDLMALTAHHAPPHLARPGGGGAAMGSMRTPTPVNVNNASSDVTRTTQFMDTRKRNNKSNEPTLCESKVTGGGGGGAMARLEVVPMRAGGKSTAKSRSTLQHELMGRISTSSAATMGDERSDSSSAAGKHPTSPTKNGSALDERERVPLLVASPDHERRDDGVDSRETHKSQADDQSNSDDERRVHITNGQSDATRLPTTHRHEHDNQLDDDDEKGEHAHHERDENG